MITLTDTVRAMLTDEGAKVLLAHVQTTVERVRVVGAPEPVPDLTRWHLDPERGRVGTFLFLDRGLPENGDVDEVHPVIISLGFRLPAGSVMGDVPEEHTHLIVHDGALWTFGDLAFTDPHRHFYAIDLWLGREACDRLHDKLRETDPHAFWTRPIWPDEAYEGRRKANQE